MLSTGGGNLDKCVKVLRAFSPAAQTSTLTGATIDTLGFNELRCDIQFGAITGTAVTFVGKLQHGDESDASDMADVTDADFASIDQTDDDSDQFAAVRAFGLKRYVRYVCTIAGTSPSAVMAGMFTLGSPKALPVSGYASAQFDLLPA